MLTGLIAEVKKNKVLFLMAVPAAALVLVFAYIPMAGMVLAFKNYRFNLGIFGSPWNGLENFRFFFISGTGLLVTKNTIFFNLLNLATSQTIALAIAIIITEIRGKYFKKITQSVIFLPYFISWVIVGVFIYNIFNFESGTMNTVLKSLNLAPVNVYGMPSIWILIINAFNSWKWAGYISVLYIAAITSIDPECFEAADIDGANIFQKITNITIPSIMPTIMILFLLSIGRILRGDFQMFYQIVGNNGQLFNTTDVIDTFVFRSLVSSGDMAMPAAATFYQSVLCFATIMIVNGVIKKTRPENALF